jgi:hypothetical protein
VINATATGFEVRESGGGTSSLSFDYRIVAKRRGYEQQRMVDVTERFNREQASMQARMPRATSAQASKAVVVAAPERPAVRTRARDLSPTARPGGGTIPNAPGVHLSPAANVKPATKATLQK